MRGKTGEPDPETQELEDKKGRNLRTSCKTFALEDAHMHATPRPPSATPFPGPAAHKLTTPPVTCTLFGPHYDYMEMP